MLSAKKAFTLIELLVVVLIVGVLAAVALPQYQRAVEKSKSAEGKTLLRSTYQALEYYYLANGVYPTSFEQLGADVPGTPVALTNPVDVYKASEDWNIYLYGNVSTGATGVSVLRRRGPYVGAGFSMWHYHYNKKIPLRTILCDEITGGPAILPRYQKEKGTYCERLFQGTYVPKQDSSDSFILP